MSLLFLAAASIASPLAAGPELTVVSLDDPILYTEGTYVSPVARTAIAGEVETQVRCLNLPEDAASHDVVCLADSEWRDVFARIAQDESSDVRDRQIAFSQWRAGVNGGRLTP